MRERATVCLDPNVRPLLVPPAAYRERIGRWCALADVLRLSEDDLALLLPGAGPEDACDRWHEAGARLVVVTLGPRGALASLDGARVTVPALPVEVADTVGAGDSFTAGLLHALAGLPPRRPPRRADPGGDRRELRVRRPGRRPHLRGPRRRPALGVRPAAAAPAGGLTGRREPIGRRRPPAPGRQPSAAVSLRTRSASQVRGQVTQVSSGRTV